MKNQGLKFAGLLSIVLVAALMIPQRAAADDDDPPSRVARLSYARGPVSFEPAGTDDWVSAVVNRPMTTGDKLWSDRDGRAELHIGSASLRISSYTGFSFLDLTDRVTQVRLSQGTLRVRVKRLDNDETFEIDTPNLAFSILRPGVYRISVSEAGDTTVIRVRGGEGEVTGGGSAYSIHPRETGTFTGTDELRADFDRYDDEGSAFDDWCDDRDRHEDRSVSARYVSPDVIGYQDLDDYGGWRSVPGYGTVWFPHTVIVGWAPYRYGHWVYIAPWGYTWVDDAPWGFAPFHYGRWIFVDGYWGWVPAPPPAPRVVYVRPVYAPALVAWVGGSHFGVGVSVGWFPLGPREVYVPSYPVSRTYVNNVNVSNTTVNTTVINNYYNTTVVNNNTRVTNNNVVINQTYVNQSAPGAVTATTHQAFVSAQPVAKNVVAVNQKEVVNAPVNAITPAAAPSRQAVLGAGASAAAKPPLVVQNRAVVAKTAPPPPPVAFAKQQQAIQANGGKPLAVSQIRQIQPETTPATHASIKIAPPSKPVVPQNTGGSKLESTPAGAGNQPGGRPAVPQNTGGNKNAGGAKLENAPAGAGNQPGATNKAGQPAGAANQPGTTNNAGQPSGANHPGSGPPSGNANPNPNRKTYDDRPPSSRPSGNANNANVGPNPQLEQKQQQQIEQLRIKQDQERQKVEQQQLQERQRLAQKNADEQKQRDLNQKHQQQLEDLERKHDRDQQNLQKKQDKDKKKPEPPAKSSKDDRPQRDQRDRP